MSATEMQGTPPSREIDPELQLVVPGKALNAGAGMTWIADGWGLFTRAPLMWIVSLILVLLVLGALSLTGIGAIIFQFLQPVIAGGFMVSCRALEKGGEFELEHLMQGFSKRFMPLFIVGLIYTAGWLVLILIFMALAGVAWMGFAMGGSEDAAAAALASGTTALMWGLVILLFAVPLTAAYWFAPALVMMHDMKPIAAMKASFFGCFRNVIPFLVYSLVMMVAAILAVLPFGLGMIVWIPVAIASTYVAYREIFTQ
ncbi:MAG TPA: BPSS1780 family membrane protein [Usitatibacter sp.]|nr:BPSS1780 family membrane protein [Usitatibacter sp.]